MAGLQVIDDASREAQQWADEVAPAGRGGLKPGWRALAAVLPALRERLAPSEAAALSAALPLMVRGLFWSGFSPEAPRLRGDFDDFVARTGERFADVQASDPRGLIEGVLVTLWRHTPEPVIYRVIDSLPARFGEAWFDAVARDSGVDQYGELDDDEPVDLRSLII